MNLLNALTSLLTALITTVSLWFTAGTPVSPPDEPVAQSTQISPEEAKITPIPNPVAAKKVIIAPLATPTPKPTPKTVAYTPQGIKAAPPEIEALFIKYGNQYGVDPAMLRHIALCESGYRPEANSGTYGGLFQFSASTWASNRKAMGLDPNPDLRFNAEEATRTAAFKMSRDGFGAWPVCGKKALAANTQ